MIVRVAPLGIALLGSLAIAGEPAPPKTETPQFVVQLADASTLKIALAESTVRIVTKYGTLTVPASEIKRIEFGLRYPPGVEVKAAAAAVNLGSPDYQTREDSEKALFELAEYAIPALRKIGQSADPEVIRRAASVEKKICDSHPNRRMDLRSIDIVETPEFTIRGQISNESLKVQTRYFADSALKLYDLRSIESLSPPGATKHSPWNRATGEPAKKD